jgi:kinesin family protein 6/9
MLKGENIKDNLEPYEIDECRKRVEEFIDNTDPSATIILADRLKINECFYYFKHIYKDLEKKGGPPTK